MGSSRWNAGHLSWRCVCITPCPICVLAVPPGAGETGTTGWDRQDVVLGLSVPGADYYDTANRAVTDGLQYQRVD